MRQISCGEIWRASKASPRLRNPHGTPQPGAVLSPTWFQDWHIYFTVLCDPHPLPLSLTGRGIWGVRADRRQTVKYLRTLSPIKTAGVFRGLWKAPLSQSGEVRSSGPDEIACWFIDSDYNEESFFVCHAYFLGNEGVQCDTGRVILHQPWTDRRVLCMEHAIICVKAWFKPT